MSSYLIPTQVTTVEQQIKDSRFIGITAPALSRESITQTVHEMTARFPGASHYCYAFMIGKPGQSTHIGMSDAGEPKGTAGKPIFNVLEHSGIGDIVVIVVRYFGGTLLGTGGLARAYGSTAQLVLHTTPTQTKIPMSRLTVTLPFALENLTRQLCHECGGHVLQQHYAQALQLHLELPTNTIDTFTQKIQHQSKKQAQIHSLENN